ncbi:unnamed protein product [Urochloa decumbens]|uniref:DUF4220 domain-containing protein n=1 Tax=Urochloa decumbens TaxID=240449 RepID=A0ABC9B0E8_9POAL
MIGLLLVLYTLMYMFSDKRLSPKAGNVSILNLLDALSDSILVYILGIMQATPSRNELFPVLALALVSSRSSVNSLSMYGTYAEFRNMLKLLAVAYMKMTHGFKLWCVPFWIFWSFLVLKSVNRIMARYLVSKSLWHGRSSELLQEYMDAFTHERCDPETMEGYKYLVYGESKRNIKIGHTLSINDSRSLITLDKIWRYDGPLLRNINMEGNNMKDLCLAFALYRLLRCRLEGATLHEGPICTTRKLICSRILTDTAEISADDVDEVLVNNANKAFGIFGMELGFLNSYLHTSYPTIFCEGLFSLTVTLLLSIVKHGMAWWLCVDMSQEQNDYTKRFMKDHQNKDAVDHDYPMALAAMILVTIMDLLEVINYVVSYWTTLLCICNAWKWELLHKITVGVVASKGDGTKLSHAIKLPGIVKAEVFKALCGLRFRSTNSESHYLPADLTSLLCASDQHWSECLQLPTCSQVILVWHIATSLCEMKLAQDRGKDLSKPGCLRSCLSWFSSRFQYQDYYMLDGRSLDGNLRTSYEVANSLSRYCAYLLVSKPDLLPDTILVPNVILQKTVSHAREILKDCDSLQSIYKKLLTVAQEEPSVQYSQDRKLSVNVLQRGAVLAKKLIEDEHHWELLAKVWVDLLVHIAPSSNTEAHAKYLESGGEFVTLIWALLSHCGIDKSELWQENATSWNSSPQSSQQKNGVAPPQVKQTVASAQPAAQPDDHASDLDGREDIEEVMETSPTPTGIS